MRLTISVLMILVVQTVYAGAGRKLLQKFTGQIYAYEYSKGSSIYYQSQKEQKSFLISESCNFDEAIKQYYCELINGQYFGKLMRGKRVKLRKDKTGYHFSVTPDGHYNEVIISFDWRKRLSKIRTLSSIGTNVATFKVFRIGKKWGIKKIEVVRVSGSYSEEAALNFEHEKGRLKQILVKRKYGTKGFAEVTIDEAIKVGI